MKDWLGCLTDGPPALKPKNPSLSFSPLYKEKNENGRGPLAGCWPGSAWVGSIDALISRLDPTEDALQHLLHAAHSPQKALPFQDVWPRPAAACASVWSHSLLNHGLALRVPLHQEVSAGGVQLIDGLLHLSGYTLIRGAPGLRPARACCLAVQQ